MHSIGVLPSASSVQSVETVELKSPTSISPSATDQGVHAYKCRGENDIRSPCPALNTLANHSYIPHDGKNITFPTLVHALHTGYGISIGFASFLVLGSYMLLRRNPQDPLDLHEVAHHKGIAHNACIAHDDVEGHDFAPSQVDPVLLRNFLEKAYTPPTLRESEDKNTVTLEDLAYTRFRRQEASGPIDALHATIASGELAMVMDIFGKGATKTLNKDDLDVWFNENRFPAGWTPNHSETLAQTMAENAKIRKYMAGCEDAAEHQEHHGLLFSIQKSLEGLLQKVQTTAHLHGDRSLEEKHE